MTGHLGKQPLYSGAEQAPGGRSTHIMGGVDSMLLRSCSNGGGGASAELGTGGCSKCDPGVSEFSRLRDGELRSRASAGENYKTDTILNALIDSLPSVFRRGVLKGGRPGRAKRVP